jgi:hypothetical protein
MNAESEFHTFLAVLDGYGGRSRRHFGVNVFCG